MSPEEQARVTTRDLASHIDDLTKAVNENTTVTSALRERVDRALSDVSDHETRLRILEQVARDVPVLAAQVTDLETETKGRIDGIVSNAKWLLGGLGVLLLAVLAFVLPHLRWG